MIFWAPSPFWHLLFLYLFFFLYCLSSVFLSTQLIVTCSSIWSLKIRICAVGACLTHSIEVEPMIWWCRLVIWLGPILDEGCLRACSDQYIQFDAFFFFFSPFSLETVSHIRNCHIKYYGPKVFFGKMGSWTPLNVDRVGFTQKNWLIHSQSWKGWDFWNNLQYASVQV